MDVLAVTSDPKAGPAIGMTQRLPGLLQYYLLHHRLEESTKATLIFYQKEGGLFIRHLENQGHSLLVNEVSKLDVMGHLAQMVDAGRKPRTRRSRLQAIKTMFNWAVESGLDGQQPGQESKTPTYTQRA